MNYRDDIHDFYDKSQDRFDDLDKLKKENRRFRNRHYKNSDEADEEMMGQVGSGTEEAMSYRSDR